MKSALFGILFLVIILALLLPHSNRFPASPRPSTPSRITHHASRITQAPPAVAVSQSASPLGPSPFFRQLFTTLESETDPDRRADLLDQAAVSLPVADLRPALESLTSCSTPPAAELASLLVRRWAEADAVAAAVWVAQQSGLPVFRDTAQQVAVSWANTDFPAAVRWAETIGDDDSRQAVTISLAYEAARNDPVTALQLVVTLSATPERDACLVHVTGQWAVTDPAAAATWAAQVAEPGLQQRLLSTIAIHAAKTDGFAAAAFAASSLVPGDDQTRAAVAIAQRWAQTSPQAAADWVALFPDSPAWTAAAQALLALQPDRRR